MDAEQHRRRARHYLIRARQMLNPINRVTMIEMAVICMRMAEWAKPGNPVIQQTQPRVSSLAVATTSKTIRSGVWDGPVPIYHEPFQPEHVALMGYVFDDVLHTLGLVDREDPITRMIAKKLIGLAQAGERDPGRLKRLILKDFSARPN